MLPDWLESRRPFAGRVFRAAFDLTGAAVFAVVTSGVWPAFANAWAEDEVAGVPGDFTFIVWPFKLLVVVGVAATAIEFAVRFLSNAIAGAEAWRAGGETGDRLSPRLGLARRALRLPRAPST